MRTQVRLYLDDDLVPQYPDWSRELFVRTNTSISGKIVQTLLELPCRPVCGDYLNLLSFAPHFGFSDFEMECLADCNYEVEVCEVVICDGFLELVVKKVE